MPGGIEVRPTARNLIRWVNVSFCESRRNRPGQLHVRNRKAWSRQIPCLKTAADGFVMSVELRGKNCRVGSGSHLGRLVRIHRNFRGRF
jgi:hypothetical protein